MGGGGGGGLGCVFVFFGGRVVFRVGWLCGVFFEFGFCYFFFFCVVFFDYSDGGGLGGGDCLGVGVFFGGGGFFLVFTGVLPVFGAFGGGGFLFLVCLFGGVFVGTAGFGW